MEFKMTLQDIARMRVVNQGIEGDGFGSVAEAVSVLGAVQAQDYQSALWAVGLRVRGAKPVDIEKALQTGKIVRMWPMRGTIHFVPAADARWMLALMSPRVLAGYARRHAFHGVDEATLVKTRQTVAKALHGGNALTRPELYAIMEKAGIKTASSRGLHLLGRMAHDALICFGPRRAGQPTFVLFDEWLPAARHLPRQDALARITLTYFTGHGPAQIQDMAWWSGLSMKDIRHGIELAGKRLQSAVVEGKTYYMGAGKIAVPKNLGAHLLPAFDEFYIGYRDRSACLEAIHAEHINPGANGMLSAMVMIDGQVRGTWKRVIKKDSVAITTKPFTPFSKAEEKAIAAALPAYQKFLQKKED